MGRLLIRSGKDPFTAVAAETAAAQDLLPGDTGNLLDEHAVHKALLTPGSEVVSNATLSEVSLATARDCARANEEFDAFVVPLGDTFVPAFRERMHKLTAFIKGLKIPVVVVGVGAQADDRGALDSIAPAVKDLVSAVLDRSDSIGVRGRFTQSYLTGLGFPETAVDVVGCPSFFLHGPDFSLATAQGDLGRESNIAFNLSPTDEEEAELLRRQAEAYPNLTYVAQDGAALELMLWGWQPRGIRDLNLPGHTGHPMYQQDRMRFFLDPPVWFEYLRECEFAFGTRLLGNVAALLAGTPAMLLARDSGSVELAEYHGMPHRRFADVPADVDASDLFAEFDPADFNRRYGDCFQAYVDFLDRNGLAHIYSAGNASSEFDKRVEAATYPPAVRTLCAPHETETAARLRWLRDASPYERTRHKRAYRLAFPHPAPPPDAATVQRNLATKVEKLERRLTLASRELQTSQRQLMTQRERVETQRERIRNQRERLTNQENRIRRLEQRLDARESRTLRNYAHRAASRLRRTLTRSRSRT
ncbi:MAG TPA: polysaccharide pyruvyl transferase family protein [Nocardioidaceae bacterium]|nr:polysaccharide pyruvyl transferase family protein [Nocardioidaceae bacterium]